MSQRSDAEWFAAAKHYEDAVKEIDKWKSLAGEMKYTIEYVRNAIDKTFTVATEKVDAVLVKAREAGL